MEDYLIWGYSSQSHSFVLPQIVVCAFISPSLFIIRHVSLWYTRYLDVKCDKINHRCVFLLHFIMTCISFFHQNQFSMFLKLESLTLFFKKCELFMGCWEKGDFALTLLEINFQIMNDRSYSDISFLDMVFIFIFLLGTWEWTQQMCFWFLFCFVWPYMKNQGLFSFPLKHLFFSFILEMGCKRLLWIQECRTCGRIAKQIFHKMKQNWRNF